MGNLLDDQLIELPCGVCGQKSPQRIGWLKTQKHFTCRCGARTAVNADQLREIALSVDKLANDLRRKLGKFGKR